MKAEEIFVAGGLPTVTYVGREVLDLESEVQAEVTEGYKIVCITGPTKSGKTVLCRKVLGRDNCLWLAGGKIASSKDCWEQLISKLDLPLQDSATESSSGMVGIRALLQVRAKIEAGASYSITHNLKAASLEHARLSGKTIVVDDFHYMPENVQREFVRAVKDDVFDGLRVVLIAVPHHAFAAINVANEMEGRFSQIEIPSWEIDDLLKISELGFPALNIRTNGAIAKKFARESFGSPLLMQRFCLRLCLKYDVVEKSRKLRELSPSDEARDEIFKSVAKHFGLPAYRKLLAGPQSRKDRIQRNLVDGGTADIYQCILYSIAKTGPRPEISYNDIRSTLQEILMDSDVPQKNQVTNAISHMVNIAKEKIEGEPVIDWTNDTLYLTDPFLMFYMRWIIKPQINGRKSGDLNELFMRLSELTIDFTIKK